MKINDHGFYFEKSGLSASQGAIDPAQQHFEGSSAEESVVRETGQNSIDASRGEGPVRMVFELKSMATKDIPDIEQLRTHLKQVDKETEGQAGHERMKGAARLADKETIMVLRISDYGTKGLTGAECIKNSKSPLSALTRGSGNSDDSGGRGGSFGIGSAVGPMMSDLSTVLYTSLPMDADQTVFAAYSRLASHIDGEGINRNGDGFFTKLNAKSDFEYLRPAPQIGSFPERTEVGTDIYILGYRMAEHDPLLHQIRQAVIENFMVAIHRKELEIVGISPAEEWTLNADSLVDYAKDRADTYAFYRAITDPEPTTKQSELLGKISLYACIDQTLDRSLHTITMRSPHMKIGQYKHTSISAKYAAVLICDEKKGNDLLRVLEPPRHNEWDPGRDTVRGAKVVKEMKDFIRTSLRERVKSEMGDTIEIKGLSRFLPMEGIEEDGDGEPYVPVVKGGSRGNEASTVSGKPSAKKTKRKKGGATSVTVTQPATGGKGDSDIITGKKRGGNSKRKNSGKGKPGKGEAGKGDSLILAGDIQFRSWIKTNVEKPSIATLVLTSKKDISGDMTLAALGLGGNPEEFTIPITAVKICSEAEESTLEFSGNTLKNLNLTGGRTVRVEIALPAGDRYRLGVE